MTVIFKYALARFRGQIIGWGIAMFLYGLMMVWFFDLIADKAEQWDKLLDLYPPEVMAFFGDITTFSTLESWLSVEYFSFIHIILGIFAVLAGSGLLASDEENGTLDLVLAHPLSRTDLFMGRLLAFTAAIVAIIVICWLGLIIPLIWSDYNVSALSLWLPLLSMLAVLLFFGGLALLLSMLLPSRGQAAMTSGILLVANFFIIGLARINEDLEPIARFSPLKYYQDGEAISDGLNITWFGGLLAFAVLFAALAWWRFLRRDIRVGGEGGWRLPSLSFLSTLRLRRAAAEPEA